MGALAWWESTGPAGGLYSLTYATIPVFSFMRAPSRFGLIVLLAFSVLAALATAELLARVSKPKAVMAFLLFATDAELAVPLQFRPVPQPEPAYQLLATLPYGPLIELPLYSRPFAFARVRYMLGSTTHWMPLVEGYSSYTPPDFAESLDMLAQFPTEDSFKRLERDRVRYAIFHLDQYGAQRDALRQRLTEFAPSLRRLYGDDRIWLYEIVDFPP
jgi:hypothetical protein